MLQDIAPYQLKNQYDPQAAVTAADFLLVIDGGKIYARVNDQIEFPTLGEFQRVLTQSQNENKKEILTEKLQFLFTVSEERYFLTYHELTEDLLVGKIHLRGYSFYTLNELREKSTLPKYRMFAAYTAKHLADWYRDTKFCGRCGSENKHSATERAMVCPCCGNTVYPRIMPAVIVGVTDKDRIVLTRYRTGYGHNALIAGFTEIGETLEETVAREVMEEVGLRVKNIRYYKSQPWGAANDILMGFYCEVDGDPTIRMDQNELKFAQWTAREDIVLQPDESSLTNEMMMRFQAGEEG